MTEVQWLIADLRTYMAWEVPTAIAVWALNHAMTERPQATAAWVVQRAAHIIRIRQ